MNKSFIVAPAVLISVVVALIVAMCFVGKNNVQNFQVIQSPSGSVRIQSDGGYYLKFFATTWTYPKVNSVFFSNETAESKDRDGVQVIFSNKGEGDISSQVVYRLYTNHESILKLHEYAHGDIDKVVDNLVLSKLKDIAMAHASNITSSQAIEDRDQLAANIRKDFVNNNELKDIGIVVEQFSITKINFDQQTKDLFKKQQEADLQKKTAEAEKLNLQMQKEKTIAEYEKQVAESRGKAEVEKIKAVTDAQRQKELAEIKAQQEVSVATLEKQKATIEANKKLEIVEIQKREEKAKLEVIQIQSEQKVAEAKAKEQQIKLSGAMSEEVKYRLDVEKETKIEVAKVIAEGLSKVKLPETFIMGGANEKMNPMETFFNLMNVEKAKQMNSVQK
jgi:regulator of protease activity HflC (stomatin/prohibitin superfamily)